MTDEPVTTPPLPPKVATALNQVMRGVQKLGKDERNPFANYKYAGIESFLEMVRPLCAEAGLLVLQDEEFYEFIHTKDSKDKDVTWLVMSFLFGLAHMSGETWGHRIRRTGMAQASMGSQAFGAAQSYALKSFLRSVGLIATGDTEDADAHPQTDLPSDYRQQTDKPQQLTKAASRTVYTQLVKEMKAATDKDAMTKWGFENAYRIHAMHNDLQIAFKQDYRDRLTAFDEGADEEGNEVIEDSEFKKKLRESLDDEIPEEGGGNEAA